MTLLQWLNKLGILRWGGNAGVYRTAAERPLELQEPGVFNAERDLIHARDLKGSTDRNTTPAERSESTKPAGKSARS
jgi:hypothetical protein